MSTDGAISRTFIFTETAALYITIAARHLSATSSPAKVGPISCVKDALPVLCQQQCWVRTCPEKRHHGRLNTGTAASPRHDTNQELRQCVCIPVAMYASSMAMQSLKSLRMKMECSRLESASSGKAHGGTTCVTQVML